MLPNTVGKVRMLVRIVKDAVLLLLGKNMGHLAFRTEFCRKQRQSSLKPINQRLSRENPKELDPSRP